MTVCQTPEQGSGLLPATSEHSPWPDPAFCIAACTMRSPGPDEPEFTAKSEAKTWLLRAMAVLANARAASQTIRSRVLDVLRRYPEQDPRRGERDGGIIL